MLAEDRYFIFVTGVTRYNLCINFFANLFVIPFVCMLFAAMGVVMYVVAVTGVVMYVVAATGVVMYVVAATGVVMYVVAATGVVMVNACICLQWQVL